MGSGRRGSRRLGASLCGVGRRLTLMTRECELQTAPFGLQVCEFRPEFFYPDRSVRESGRQRLGDLHGRSVDSVSVYVTRHPGVSALQP